MTDLVFDQLMMGRVVKLTNTEFTMFVM